MRRRRVEDSPAIINNVILLHALLQMQALQLGHDRHSHVGETKTIHTILAKFDWPGLHKDVAKYVNNCLACQCSKPAKQRTNFPLKPIHSSAPNELLFIDHLKLSTTKDGHLGVLLMLDHLKKFAVAAPYRLCDAQETCRLILEHWVEPYEAPLAIQSDNGVQFTAALTAEMMKHLDILRIHSSSCHPQTNGLVERQNRALILLLRSVCSRKEDDWDKLLPSVIGAYNSTRHASTGFSPHLLWLGRDERIPLMLLSPKRETGYLTCREYIGKKIFRRSTKDQQMASSNIRQAQVRQKLNYDQDAVQLHPYQEGDQVLVSVKVILKAPQAPCPRGTDKEVAPPNDDDYQPVPDDPEETLPSRGDSPRRRRQLSRHF